MTTKTITQEKISSSSSRPTFEEAINALAESVGSGGWLLTELDKQKLKEFSDKFAGDLEYITGRPYKMYLYTINVKDNLKRIIREMDCTQYCRNGHSDNPFEMTAYFPTSYVYRGDKTIHDGEVIEPVIFEALCPYNPRKVSRYYLKDSSLKDPDDFTRKVPKRITKLLKKLKKTNFDYQPKILDGFLYKKTFLEKNTFFEEVLIDPALVLMTPYGEITVDYWEEKEKFRWFRRGINKFFQSYHLRRSVFWGISILMFTNMLQYAFEGLLMGAIGIALMTFFSGALAVAYHNKSVENEKQEYRLE